MFHQSYLVLEYCWVDLTALLTRVTLHPTDVSLLFFEEVFRDKKNTNEQGFFFPSLATYFCSFSSFTAEFLTWVMWYNFIFHKTWNLFDINVKELELLAIKTTEAKHLRQSYVFTVVYLEVPGMSASVNGIKGEIIDILVIPINFAKPPNIWNRTQQLLYREEKCHSCCKSLLSMPS